MAKINRFEDLDVWQKSMALCNDVYLATDGEYFSKDFALRDQVRKSCISIPSNIAEGFERESNNQFIYFLLISKASAGELRTQIYIVKEREYITNEIFEKLIANCTEVSKSLSGFITYLRQVRRTKV